MIFKKNWITFADLQQQIYLMETWKKLALHGYDFSALVRKLYLETTKYGVSSELKPIKVLISILH